MGPVSTTSGDPANPAAIKKKPISWNNIAFGAALNMFETTTLGQPFEVVKTHMAANRQDGLFTAVKKTYGRGGIFGFYQGLIPWAWIEASTKGAVLLFTASELEYAARAHLGLNSGTAGIVAGIGGGITQAYATMGFCTFMKTVEITRQKSSGPAQTSFQVAREIFAKEGIRGINKGVNAVALRQATNWGSRIGITRFVEEAVKKSRGGDETAPLTMSQKIMSSAVGGALSCWNQPIEVIRVELQSQIKQQGRPEKMSILQAFKWIYSRNGMMGFYRGVTPRIGLGIWQTVCMVAGGDYVKKFFEAKKASAI